MATPTTKRAPARPLMTATRKDAWRGLIAAQLPASKVYVEPFARDAAVFWAKARSEDTTEVLADDDKQVVGFYKFLRDASDDQLAELRGKVWTWDSVQFEKLRKGSRPRKRVDDAYRTKYLHLFSVKGDGTTLDSTDAARKRTGKSFLAGLEGYRERLKGVEIVLADAADVLDKYDGPDTLFYVDAPADRAEELSVKLDGLQGKAIVTSSGKLTLGESWRTAEIRKAAKVRQLAMNFTPAAPTAKDMAYPKTDGCEYVYVTGGAHSHDVNRELREACMGGWHSHLFQLDGVLVYTDWNGEHRHYLDGDVALPNTTAHTHELELGEVELETELGGEHSHEVTDLDWTGYGGVHVHEIDFSGQKIQSLTPASFWEIFSTEKVTTQSKAAAAPSVPKLDDYPNGPLQVAVLRKGAAMIIAVRGSDFAEAWELSTKADPSSFERIVDAKLIEDVAGAEIVDKGTVEIGLATPELRELFLSTAGSFSGSLVLEHSGEGWSATLSKCTPPLVTSARTLDVPLALGRSALPEAIAAELPPALQFWKCADAHTAMMSRRALACAGIGPVRVVNKQLARVALSVAKAGPMSDAPTTTDALTIARAAVGEPARVIPARTAATVPLSKLTGALAAETADYLVEWPDSADARADLLRVKGATVFRVRGDDKIFVSNKPPHAGHMIEQLGAKDASAALAEKGLNSMRLFAVKNGEMDDGMEHFVLGIVLAPTTPDNPDLQKDWYSVEEIRKACHFYMEHHAHVGWHHRAIVDGKIKILENYIALADFETTTADGSPIKILAGTWIMGFRVRDSKLWAETLASIGGLSIGGWSKHRVAA